MNRDTPGLSTDAAILSVGPCLKDARDVGRLRDGLARLGFELIEVHDDADAALALCGEAPAAVLVDLGLQGMSPLAIADLAALRHPATPIIFVARGALFADGAIFAHATNASAILPGDVDVGDLLEVLAYRAVSKVAHRTPAPA